MLSPVPLLQVAAGPISGWISDTIGTRWLTTTGMLLSCLAAALLTTLGTPANAGDILLRFVLFGIGLGVFPAPNMSALINSVERRDVSFAASSIALFRNLGQAMGIAAANVVINFTLSGTKAPVYAPDADVLLAALKNSWWLAAILGLTGAAVSLMKESKTHKSAGSPL